MTDEYMLASEWSDFKRILPMAVCTEHNNGRTKEQKIAHDITDRSHTKARVKPKYTLEMVDVSISEGQMYNMKRKIWKFVPKRGNSTNRVCQFGFSTHCRRARPGKPW